MSKPIYGAKIFGDSPAWARLKRDCLKRHFAKRGIDARVTAVQSNVRVALGRYKSGAIGRGTWESLSVEMTRAERACKI